MLNDDYFVPQCYANHGLGLHRYIKSSRTFSWSFMDLLRHCWCLKSTF